jgi:hypothetical protein
MLDCPQRTAGGQRLQPYCPLAVLAGFRGRILALKFHAHGFARIGAAPDAHRHAVLQHHVLGNHGGQFDAGLNRARKRQSQHAGSDRIRFKHTQLHDE